MYLVLVLSILNLGMDAILVISDIRHVCFERFILVLPALGRVQIRCMTLILRPSVYIDFIAVISVLS